MNSEEAKAFVRRHFEDFVNRHDLSAADRNFAAGYQEHGSDVPPGLASRQKIEFAGFVIWRIAQGKLAERCAYLQAPHCVH